MVDALWRGGCAEVVVVTGADAVRVRQALGAGRHQLVVNPAWETGMASSFRVGIDAAAAYPEGLVMVTLVDQPDVDAGVVDQLRRKASPHRVTAAGYPDATGKLVRGHPVIFPLRMAEEAAATAAGDAGARGWLREHPELIDLVDVGHLATGRDVDTPADLQWWQETGAQHDPAG